MIPFSELPISKKLMRMNMLVSVSVLLFALAAFIGYELATFRSSTVKHLSSDAEIIGINVTPALQFDDERAAAETLAALRATPNVVSAAVYRPDGRVFAKYVRDPGAARATIPSQLRTTERTQSIRGENLVVLKQIVASGKPIGTVYIRSDLNEIKERLLSYGRIALGVLASSFAVALLVSWLLARRIAEPILSLVETARAIVSRHDYSLRAVITSRDETAILGDAFNEMVRQIEEQTATLQEGERHFRELANAMPQIVWIASAEGKPEYCNQRWFEYAGGEADCAQMTDWTSRTHPDDIPKYIEAWDRSVRTGEPFTMEHRLRRASDGADRWHLGRALPVRDKKGQIIRWFGTYTDIDDQKRAEEDVRQINADLEARVEERTEKLIAANKELASANLAKDHFLATMSHELRTPLNAIVGFTGTLLMKLPGPLNVDQESQLKIVRTSARHLLSLINDLLDLAKIKSGKVVLNLESVNCKSVIDEVATSLRPLAEGKGLLFEVFVPAEVVTLSTDRRALSQILINLTNNAIKFTQTGFVRMEIRKLAGEKVEIFVTDSGMGIKDEDQRKLFQAFEQVHGAGGHFEGTGLGLHLSQQLASRLGGTIVCESAIGSGSRFSLVL